MQDPHLLTFTQMKNEGPFILEWVAWQRLIGADQIVVLSNDCDDGTDAILDRLDRMGVLRHLPNPMAIAPGDSPLRARPQATGFAYGRLLREWRDADYILLCDVDEFPCFRDGDTTLKGLLKRLDYPDVLTLAEVPFGAGDITTFEDRPVTGQFTQSAGLAPGKWRSRRGFKSICRNDERMVIRNHRPRVLHRHARALRWLDGSGRDFPEDLRLELHKGGDCRGMYDLVGLNHYALRSLESYLVKAARGQPMGGHINQRYFRQRNQVRNQNTEMLAAQPRIEEEIARLKSDPELADLHAAAVAAHRAKIDMLKATPLYQELIALARTANA
ncbi:MAG: glycosyltransferase family 2 protein [Silicimonas sp.]|nr:glycosyltransferase family 2 protein [Silicimonas sp.]